MTMPVDPWTQKEFEGSEAIHALSLSEQARASRLKYIIKALSSWPTSEGQQLRSEAAAFLWDLEQHGAVNPLTMVRLGYKGDERAAAARQPVTSDIVGMRDPDGSECYWA